MGEAFGEARTIPASNETKEIMKQLETKGIFDQQRDVWMLGAALGISTGQTFEGASRETFQNINSLDPEGIFAAIMTGLHPDLLPDQRLKKLVDYAEWGIREISRKDKNGTLDFTSLGNSSK
ncbi:MAG: helix-turn-helix domain-containing protein [Candidatus Thermoplasmatota archaeon]|nr:helix-turn-helix domain-containing protein [Candidatus Thermoplasmatota archaeon]